MRAHVTTPNVEAAGQPPASRTPPKDGSPLGHLSDAELYNELVRRRMPGGVNSLETYETLAADMGQLAGEVMLEATIASLPPEDSTPKAVPQVNIRS